MTFVPRQNIPVGAMRNPNRRTTNLADYTLASRKFAKSVPTREMCDLTDPREMFLWTLVAIPGLNGGPLLHSTAALMMVSEHLYECGVQLACESCGHTRAPEKKYRPPIANDPNMFSSPGRWVPPETPDPEVSPAAKALSGLTWQQKSELRALLNAEHENDPA